MAVKPEKIKERLRALFPKANLSQKRLDAYAAKLAPKPADEATDADVDVIINDYNEIIDFVAVAQEDDRVRTLEAAKAKADADKAKGAGKNKEEEEEEVIEVDNDAPAWAKALLKQNEKLTSDLEALKTGKVIETKKQNASELFAKSEVLKRIPEGIRQNWVNRIDVNSETPFEEQIQALETEYSTLVQETANSNSYPGPAGGGNPPSTVDEKLVDDIVSSM